MPCTNADPAAVQLGSIQGPNWEFKSVHLGTKSELGNHFTRGILPWENVTAFSDPLPGMRSYGRMETIRLRAVQHPSRVERLLVSFASSAGIVAESAYLLRDLTLMPSVLQRVVAEAVRQGHAWCCWSDDTRVWLFTGEMSLALSRECGSPVLDVKVYREDGRLEDSDCWMVDRESKWRRCAVTNAGHRRTSRS